LASLERFRIGSMVCEHGRSERMYWTTDNCAGTCARRSEAVDSGSSPI
jgi:hypothetical protein